jgi:hypothetical protein
MPKAEDSDSIRAVAARTRRPAAPVAGATVGQLWEQVAARRRCFHMGKLPKDTPHKRPHRAVPQDAQTDRADDAWQHAHPRTSIARRHLQPPVAPPTFNADEWSDEVLVPVIRTAHSVHEVRPSRRQRQARLDAVARGASGDAAAMIPDADVRAQIVGEIYKALERLTMKRDQLRRKG